MGICQWGKGRLIGSDLRQGGCLFSLSSPSPCSQRSLIGVDTTPSWAGRISSFFSGFGTNISKILDYQVDRPSRSDFKFFLWFWKKYFKNLKSNFKFFLWFLDNYFKILRLIFCE